MADSNKLALIYSKLAELELQKQKQANIWGEITKKCTVKDLDPRVVNDIEDIFRDATQSGVISDGSNGEKPVLTMETVDKIRYLFLAEQQFADQLHESLETKIKNLHSFEMKRDSTISEIFHSRESLVLQEKRLKEYEELCRNLNKLCKEKDDGYQSILENEKLKTSHLENECNQSIETVNKKIEDEENDLFLTSNENDELKTKLESFLIHLNLRKEKLKNEEKTKELFYRLKDTKKQQLNYFHEQNELKLSSLHSNINHLDEVNHNLMTQLSSFQDKFSEFEMTLEKSNLILEKIDERQDLLNSILSKLSSDATVLQEKVKESDFQIIKTIEKKNLVETEILQKKGMLEKLEKKCRKLLTKRQKLMKDHNLEQNDLLKALNKEPVAAVSVVEEAKNAVTGGGEKKVEHKSSTPEKAVAAPAAALTAGESTHDGSDGAVPSSSSSSSSLFYHSHSSHPMEGKDKEDTTKSSSSSMDRLKTPSPPTDPTTASSSSAAPAVLSNSKTSTPSRRIHHFVMSSSSASSPSRIQNDMAASLVGDDGSPMNSPNTSQKIKKEIA
jgi:hypothetical protein